MADNICMYCKEEIPEHEGNVCYDCGQKQDEAFFAPYDEQEESEG